MSAALVDLSAVARARAALVALVEAHPQLASPAAQARAERWLGEEPVERLDPDHGESVLLSLRISKPLAAALDAELARWRADNPGFPASRATIARAALLRAFALVPPSAPTAPPSSEPVEPAPRPAHAAPLRPVAATPALRLEHVERPSTDARQLAIPGTAPANDAQHEAPTARAATAPHPLLDRFTAARERASASFDDARRALEQSGWPSGGVALEKLRTELAKPTGALSAEQVAAVERWCAAVEAAPPSPPSSKRARASGATLEEIARNDALRARYVAALAAKLLTTEPTATRIGCSEPTLRQWKNGTVRCLGADKDPEGMWLAKLEAILDELDSSGSTA